MGDDVLVALEDAVREVVVPEELPDVLGGIEFGRSRRKQGDVVRHPEVVGDVPSCAIQDQDRMSAASNLCADLLEMRVHCLGFAPRHDQPGTFSLGRTDRAEGEPWSAIGPRTMASGPVCALVVGCPGAGASSRPSSCDLVFLTHSTFVLPPHFYRRVGWERVADLIQLGWKGF
jgi:hypothetical protein